VSGVSVPNFTIPFSEVKVKVQGQNCRTENLPLVIAQLWCRIFYQLWQSDRSNFGMKYNFQQNSRWRLGGDFRSVNVLCSYYCIDLLQK